MTIKKTLAAVGSAVLAVPTLFAEGESSAMEVKIDKAEEAVDAIGKALSDLISGKITENVLLILGTGLVICAIFLGVRWMLRGGKTAAK